MFNVVERFSLHMLFDKYKNILWEDGNHKYNVTSFIGELNEILLGERFSAFDQGTLDDLIGKLRERGNSNATINRKMAALSKLLRKAYKMGDIHSLPEFRRQKERAGRIRFLEYGEEDRLFAAIKARCEDSYRLCMFLVDTGCRLGEALGLIWNDIQGHRVSFWITKSGRSRTIPLTCERKKPCTLTRLSSERGRSRCCLLSASARSGTKPRQKSASAATIRLFRTFFGIPAHPALCRAASTSGACKCGWVIRPCR